MAKKKNLRNGNSFWSFFGFGDAVRFVLGRNYPSKNIPGFTLIELLIAIAIIGVLASSVILMMNPLAQFAKTHDAQRKNDLEQIRQALDTYYNDNNKYPSDGGVGVGKIDGINWGDAWSSYMTKIPKDPSSSQSYRYESPIDGDAGAYRLYAKLERCSDSQSLPGVDCLRPENYSINSSNLTMLALIPTPTPTPIPPTPTPVPTATPTPTPTPTPIPTKRVFITSCGMGNIGGLSGADGICQSAADNASSPLGGRWMAWLSGSSGPESAFARLSHATVRYVLVDETLVANNWTDLVTNKSGNYLAQSIVKDENNVTRTGYVWTNTNPDGSITSTTSTCSNWTSSSNIYKGMVGHNSKTDVKWTAIDYGACNNNFYLYCFEQ